MDAVTTAQVATAIGTGVLAFSTIVLAVATVILSRGASKQAAVSREIVQENRELVRANREMVEEMRQTRIAQDRPHVLVDLDFTYAPALDIVIRNIGRGPAKNIKFDPLPDLPNARGKNGVNPIFRTSDQVNFRPSEHISPRILPAADTRG